MSKLYSPYGQAGESPCEAVSRTPSTAAQIRCALRNGDFLQDCTVKRLVNDGSGRGLGSNEVAIVQGIPSTYTYDSFLKNEGKNRAALAGGKVQRKPYKNKSPVYVQSRALHN